MKLTLVLCLTSNIFLQRKSNILILLFKDKTKKSDDHSPFAMCVCSNSLSLSEDLNLFNGLIFCSKVFCLKTELKNFAQ